MMQRLLRWLSIGVLWAVIFCESAATALSIKSILSAYKRIRLNDASVMVATSEGIPRTHTTRIRYGKQPKWHRSIKSSEGPLAEDGSIYPRPVIFSCKDQTFDEIISEKEQCRLNGMDTRQTFVWGAFGCTMNGKNDGSFGGNKDSKDNLSRDRVQSSLNFEQRMVMKQISRLIALSRNIMDDTRSDGVNEQAKIRRDQVAKMAAIIRKLVDGVPAHPALEQVKTRYTNYSNRLASYVNSKLASEGRFDAHGYFAYGFNKQRWHDLLKTMRYCREKSKERLTRLLSSRDKLVSLHLDKDWCSGDSNDPFEIITGKSIDELTQTRRMGSMRRQLEDLFENAKLECRYYSGSILIPRKMVHKAAAIIEKYWGRLV